MSENSNAASGGLSVTGLLGVLFIGLKLCGKIDWSWWWVLCPFWGPVVLVLVVAAIVLIVALVVMDVATLSAWTLSRRSK